jgi:hypothetical protein
MDPHDMESSPYFHTKVPSILSSSRVPRHGRYRLLGGFDCFGCRFPRERRKILG